MNKHWESCERSSQTSVRNNILELDDIMYVYCTLVSKGSICSALGIKMFL